jgi:hypothetical protein
MDIIAGVATARKSADLSCIPMQNFSVIPTLQRIVGITEKQAGDDWKKRR